MVQVNEYSSTRGVLIYANDTIAKKLAEEFFVTRVTEDTSDEDLRRMDRSIEGLYPIYLITEDYGIRGLDFRAPGNLHGICMIICSSFRDQRTRL